MVRDGMKRHCIEHARLWVKCPVTQTRGLGARGFDLILSVIASIEFGNHAGLGELKYCDIFLRQTRGIWKHKEKKTGERGEVKRAVKKSLEVCFLSSISPFFTSPGSRASGESGSWNWRQKFTTGERRASECIGLPRRGGRHHAKMGPLTANYSPEICSVRGGAGGRGGGGGA